MPVGCTAELSAKLGLTAAAGTERMRVGCCGPGLGFPSWTMGGGWIYLPHQAGDEGSPQAGTGPGEFHDGETRLVAQSRTPLPGRCWR